MSSRVPVVRFVSFLFPFLVTVSACLYLGGCASGRRQFSSSAAVQATGSVHGGQQPITGASIQLYAAGTSGDGSSSTALISTTVTTSDGSGVANANANAGNANNTLPAGFFTITGAYTCPSPSAQVYLVATGGNPGLPSGGTNPQIALMAALGSCGNLSASTSVQVNELTTVASMAPLFSFMSSYSDLGSAAGTTTQLTSDFSLVPQYGDISTGTVPGPALPAGYYASSTEIRTLADIVAACVNSAGGTAGDTTACGQLFTLTTPANGTAPTDTVQAVLNVLKNPTMNTAAIFGLLVPAAPFQPTLAAAPQSFVLPITADGTPARLAFTTQPTNSIATGTLNPVVVSIEDGNGSPVTTATGAITLTLGNARGATLGGTVTVNAVNGVATFSDLRITTAASSYTLTASEPGLASATSSSFTVSAGDAAKLSFSRVPVPTATGALGTTNVQVLDALGNLTRAAVPVTIALGTNPVSATLSGATTVTSSFGTASFANLSVNFPATAYTLVASSPGLTSATTSFDVIGWAAVSGGSYELGRSGNISVVLSIAAPPSGVVLTLANDNPSVLTIGQTVSIPGGTGALVVTTPYATTHIGTANVTVSGTNYSARTSAVTVTTRISINSYGITTYQGLLANTSISISGVAPSDGLTLNVAVDNPAVATAPATVTIPAGASSVPLVVTGTGIGNTTLRVTYPSNPSASAPVTGYATPALSVTALDNLLAPRILVGNNMYNTLQLSAVAGPAADEVVAVTSSDPTHFLLSTDATQVGAASVDIPLARNSTTFPKIYLQGQNYSGTTAITATLTVSAPVYGNTVQTEVLYPSGLSLWTSGTMSTTNISAPTDMDAFLVVLFPGSLQVQSFAYELLGPQASPIQYTVTSSTPGVGTIVGSPAVINVGENHSAAPPKFQPVSVGTSQVSVVQPAGYYPGSFPTLWATQLTMTVAQATISVGSPTIGNNTYSAVPLTLVGRPQYDQLLTITSSDPTHFLLATSPNGPGTATVTLPLAQNDLYVQGTVYVFGQNFSGSAVIHGTITASAPNYAAGTGTVSLYPTGIALGDSTITATAGSSYSYVLHPEVVFLDPATGAYIATANNLTPQFGPLSLTVTSSNPAVGTITNSSVTIPAGSYMPASNYPVFVPLTPGTTTITVSEPAGFTAPTGGYFTDRVTAIVQ